MKTSTRTRVLIKTLKKRAARIQSGSEEELKALGRSFLAHPIHPILVRASDLAVGDGNRRVTGLELLGETEVEVEMIEGDPTDLELDKMAYRSAYHRSPLGGYEQACIARSVKTSAATMTNKAVADELAIDPAMVTKQLSLFDCDPEVQEAARAGKIGVTVWYAIWQSDDQPAALKAALNGSSREELNRGRKRQDNGTNGQPAVRVAKIKIPLANDTATGTVTVAGGESIDLEDAELLLKEAIKAVKSARDKRLCTKTAQAQWRDMANAGS